MPAGNLQVTKIQGLNPAQDPRQFTGPTLIRGQNVLIDAEGVYSAFGDHLVSERIIADAQNASTFRLDGMGIIACTEAMVVFTEATASFDAVFEFVDAGEDFPWSCAVCGGYYVFSKFGVDGLVYYNVNTGVWHQETSASYPGVIPASMYGVCAAFGRLVYIADGVVGWTDIDDPTHTGFGTDINTGKGVQSLTVIGTGKPLGVFESTLGFICMTRTGMLSFAYVTSQIPFTFKKIVTKEIPINPYAIVQIEQGKTVYATAAGFRITDGGPPQPWEPLMSENFTQKVYPSLQLVVNPIIRLSFSEDDNLFYISVSSETNRFIYQYSYALYLPTGQWGIFSEPHVMLGELYYSSGVYAGFNFGYVDTSGYFRQFVNLPRRESSDYNGNANQFLYFAPYDGPTQLGINSAVFSTHFRINEEYPQLVTGVYNYLTTNFGIETDPGHLGPTSNTLPTITSEDWNVDVAPDEDWNVDTGDDDWISGGFNVIFCDYGLSWWNQASAAHSELNVQSFSSINSYADIGLFRLSDGQYADRLSDMNNLMLGTGTQSLFTFEDYLTSTNPDEDWNVISGSEDWGAGVFSSNSFDCFFTGSLDGVSVFNDQYKTADEINVTDSGIYYAFVTTGIYHYVTVSALNDNQSFRLKTAEMSGILAGRLF